MGSRAHVVCEPLEAPALNGSVRSRSDRWTRLGRESKSPHVLIVGAGIGGLCLAQGLKKAGVAFTVFERDPTPHFSTQGYRVHIDTTGYEALKAALPKDKFELFLTSTGQIFPSAVYCDAHSAAASRPRRRPTTSLKKQVFSVDRAMLRALLLSGLEESTEIEYGLEFKRFHVLPNGRVEVHFENGRFVQGTLLVGADGPTSRVRRQYLPDQIQVLDTDCSAIYGKTCITSELAQLGLVADHTTVVASQQPRLALVIEPQNRTQLDPAAFAVAVPRSAAQYDGPNEQDDLHQYVSWVLLARTKLFHAHDGLRVHDLYAMEPLQIADVALQLTADWHPQLRAIVDRQGPIVTLLGDAAHTMAPLGIACSAALQDASELCGLLTRIGVTTDAVAEYEQKMLERARHDTRMSAAIGRELYDLPSLASLTVLVEWE